MKVSDDMVEAACKEYWREHWNGFFPDSQKNAIRPWMRRALEEAMKVYAMEQLIEAGTEQMEQEVENG